MSIGFGLKALAGLGTAMLGGIAGVAGESMGLTGEAIAVIEDVAYGAGLGGKVDETNGKTLENTWCKPNNTTRRVMAIEDGYLNIADCVDASCSRPEFKKAWVTNDESGVRYRLVGTSEWTDIWRKSEDSTELFFRSQAEGLARPVAWTPCAQGADEIAAPQTADDDASRVDGMIVAAAPMGAEVQRAAMRSGHGEVDGLSFYDEPRSIEVQVPGGGSARLRFAPSTGRTPIVGYGETGDVVTAVGEIKPAGEQHKWYAITTHGGRPAYLRSDLASVVSDAQLSRLSSRSWD